MTQSVQSASLPDFARAEVLVVGDVMLDVYWQGAASRISPEAPVPIVRVDGERACPGGAGTVALNIAALGARVRLLGLVGEDAAADDLETLLTQQGVKTHLLRLPKLRTIRKLRVLSQHQQLIRLDFEDSFLSMDSDSISTAFASASDGCPAVVFSDYGKGTLTDVAGLIAQSRAQGRISLVDPKGTDFGRYRGADVITPNMREFEAVAGACRDEAGLRMRGETLRDSLDLRALLITRSDRGMTLIERNGWSAGKLPVFQNRSSWKRSRKSSAPPPWRRRKARVVLGSVPGARPMPRSIRPG